MPNKITLYSCAYCGAEFTEIEECTEHEKSHVRDYSDSDTQEIIDMLRQFRDEAYSYHIGNTVMGIPVSSFESLMNESAKRLENSLK